MLDLLWNVKLKYFCSHDHWIILLKFTIFDKIGITIAKTRTRNRYTFLILLRFGAFMSVQLINDEIDFPSLLCICLILLFFQSNSLLKCKNSTITKKYTHRSFDWDFPFVWSFLRALWIILKTNSLFPDEELMYY